MSYIEFDKTQLINLEYSLKKELIRSNRAGSYSATTIIYCNTRKYHGLLVCPFDSIDSECHVMLSTLDETVIQHEKQFNIGIHKFPGTFHPAGHKYIRDFITNPIPIIKYRVGGVILQKEVLLAEEQECVLVRYTLLEANSPTKIQLKPFLAFRNFHQLSKANMFANTKVDKIENGIKSKMYEQYPYLHMQISKKNTFYSAPDWHLNIEYPEEQNRGYEYQEDLFVPGFFEFEIKKGESVVFAAGLDEIKTKDLLKQFQLEIEKRVPRNSYEQCLQNAAQQFFIRRNGKTEIVAGFPWFGTWGRDTFISLPGLTLTQNDSQTCKDVLDSISTDLKDGLFRNTSTKKFSSYNSADSPLWYFWTIQQYVKHTGKYKDAWKDWGEKMTSILNHYKNGTHYNIKMHENNLVWAGQDGIAVTWMDASLNGLPVTPRTGYTVEINALWYNAIMFALELAEKNKNKKFIAEWKPVADSIPQSFIDTFWISSKGYLADFVDEKHQNWEVRPNMIFAASLPYSPISDEMKKAVLDVVEKELLTSRGLRTLSPRDPKYQGVYYGTPEERDLAYHNGSVWPWLLGAFCETYLKINEKSGISLVKKIYKELEPELFDRGIGTISELFNGNPPHEARGAISQAWSVAELLRINQMIKDFEKQQ